MCTRCVCYCAAYNLCSYVFAINVDEVKNLNVKCIVASCFAVYENCNHIFAIIVYKLIIFNEYCDNVATDAIVFAVNCFADVRSYIYDIESGINCDLKTCTPDTGIVLDMHIYPLRFVYFSTFSFNVNLCKSGDCFLGNYFATLVTCYCDGAFSINCRINLSCCCVLV